MRSTRNGFALWGCVALASLAFSGCTKSSNGCSAETAGAGGAGGAAGSAGAGGGAAIAKIALPKGHEVLFIGGFMSEFYDELSVNLENEVNDALENAARALNVHIDLPLDKDIDVPIGDAIADALPRIELPIEPGRFISFQTQMRYFDAQGVAYQNLSDASKAFDTSESVEHNAAAILGFLRTTHKKIVIVTHSKGGLDTLEALLDAPELWGKTVVGWVALQAPFHGSPLADSSPPAVSDLLLSAVGGNGQSVEDLKTVTRRPYMEANEDRIAKLTARIPTISAYSTYEASGTAAGFATTYARSIFNSGLASEITRIVIRNYRDTPLDLPRVIRVSTGAAITLIRQRVADALSAALATIGPMDLTNLYLAGVLGLPNDGLVPKASTPLRGAVHLELPPGDHASPIMHADPMKSYWTADQRNAVTWELITEVHNLARNSP
jgi:pimeloyl-ACP methyl ester carboxylesterase